MSEEKRRADDMHIATLASDIRHIKDTMDTNHTQLTKLVVRHDREIYGPEGGTGLKGEVGKLQQSEGHRSKRELGLWAVILGVIVSIVRGDFPGGSS